MKMSSPPSPNTFVSIFSWSMRLRASRSRLRMMTTSNLRFPSASWTEGSDRFCQPMQPNRSVDRFKAGGDDGLHWSGFSGGRGRAFPRELVRSTNGGPLPVADGYDWVRWTWPMALGTVRGHENDRRLASTGSAPVATHSGPRPVPDGGTAGLGSPRRAPDALVGESGGRRGDPPAAFQQSPASATGGRRSRNGLPGRLVTLRASVAHLWVISLCAGLRDTGGGSPSEGDWLPQFRRDGSSDSTSGRRCYSVMVLWVQMGNAETSEAGKEFLGHRQSPVQGPLSWGAVIRGTRRRATRVTWQPCTYYSPPGATTDSVRKWCVVVQPYGQSCRVPFPVPRNRFSGPPRRAEPNSAEPPCAGSRPVPGSVRLRPVCPYTTAPAPHGRGYPGHRLDGGGPGGRDPHRP